MTLNSHTKIRKSIQHRIQSGEWALGDRIPDEVELAEEYGCARTTVNRALRALAEEGLLIRKRKGGTRVNPFPVRKATLDIPVLREQIESTGARYRHQIVEQMSTSPPASVRSRLRLDAGEQAFYLETIHLADDRPFAFEIRWVNIKAVPEIFEAPLSKISANEWLVRTVPFSTGDVAFMAVNVDEKVSEALDTPIGTAALVIDRTTWLGEEFVTTIKLYYREGYQLYSKL